MDHEINVKKYLSEACEQILGIIAQTIDKKEKIHINAPVGSGKTTLILELIQTYPDKRFIVLFPQISITEQVKTKLTALKIESSEVNAKTIDRVVKKNAGSLSSSKEEDIFADIKKIDETNKNILTGSLDRVFLTTVDSAYKLFDNLKFESGETIVVLDETHTFLTSARENHTRSVESILKNGFPIVGFSATPSNWVNKMLFGIDNSIKVNTTETKNPAVKRISVKNNAIKTLAHNIAEENKTLAVVFTEHKNTQAELQVRINEYNPKITVRCLNAESKTSKEKETWDYLMKNDKLPSGTNVFILNSVVQSGINILNPKIDTVYLFGTFDPFGFAQYLGRCRKYKKNFKYYHSPCSRQPVLFNGADEIQTRIDWMIKFLEASSDEFAMEIKNLMGTLSYKDADQNLVVNKCLVARSFFEKLTDLGGDTLTKVVTSLFKDIKFRGEKVIEGIITTSSTSKAKSRAKGKADLVEFIKKEYVLINKVFAEMNFDYTESNLINTIKTKFGGSLALLKQQSDKLNRMVEFMTAAQMPAHRLSTAAFLYKSSGKNDEVLKEYINMSNNTAGNISGAIKYFDSFSKSNTSFKKGIKDLKACIGDTHTAKNWKSIVCRAFPGLNNFPGVTDNFYKFCIQTKRSNGKLKLEGINMCLNDYIEGLELEHIIIVNGKIAPK